MRNVVVIAGLLLLTPPVAAQTSDRARAVAAEAAVKNAAAELRKLAAGSAERYREERDRLRGSIHRTVDGFVEGTNGQRGAAAIADDLSTVLDEQIPPREYGDPPSARAVKTPRGTGLLVTYSVRGERHDSSGTVRAYALGASGRYELVTAATDDFDGFTVRSRPVPSPLPAESWLMVWGPKEGFNGTLIRFRLYAFDGETLRTVWAPADMLDAEIAIGGPGFSIRHLLKDQRPWQFVRDQYQLMPDGPQQIGQQPVD